MSLNNIEEIASKIRQNPPKIHCLTNPVTMQDVANILLAAGGSAVMGQDEQEVREITSFCNGTLLNTGVPDNAKMHACILAGQKANELGHPVVLDPVGAGASAFRRRELTKLLETVHPTAIRCNQEEAVVLCSLLSDTDAPQSHGGVESALTLSKEDVCQTALKTAGLFRCTVLITGPQDVVSDGNKTQLLTGGDSRIRRITGGGCMLSALCALFLYAHDSAFEAVCAAGQLWRDVAYEAGRRTDASHSGIGSFHVHLFDILEKKLMNLLPEQLKLYAVTDRSWLKPGETLSEVTEELLKAGVTCVQLREKNASDEEILQEAALLKPVCERYHVPLIINDRPDLAKKAGASGVHVGLSDMGIQKARQLLGPDFIIGGSAHNVEEALAAQEAGADYIGCGAVFGSTTKTNVTQLPIETLKAICQAVKIPVVAIGGVTADNLHLLSGTGISGAAVVSGLFKPDDKAAAVGHFMEELKKL